MILAAPRAAGRGRRPVFPRGGEEAGCAAAAPGRRPGFTLGVEAAGREPAPGRRPGFPRGGRGAPGEAVLGRQSAFALFTRGGDDARVAAAPGLRAPFPAALGRGGEGSAAGGASARERGSKRSFSGWRR